MNAREIRHLYSTSRWTDRNFRYFDIKKTYHEKKIVLETPIHSSLKTWPFRFMEGGRKNSFIKKNTLSYCVSEAHIHEKIKMKVFLYKIHKMLFVHGSASTITKFHYYFFVNKFCNFRNTLVTRVISHQLLAFIDCWLK